MSEEIIKKTLELEQQHFNNIEKLAKIEAVNIATDLHLV